VSASSSGFDGAKIVCDYAIEKRFRQSHFQSQAKSRQSLMASAGKKIKKMCDRRAEAR
jgi:hypothetical protein